MPISDLNFTLYFLLEFIESWWWVILPFLLWKPLRFIVLWWRNEIFISKKRMVLLELFLPKTVEKPIRAMETVMTGIHGAIYHPPGNWWEKWVDGMVQLSVHFEIASIGGITHFYVRTESQYREAVESSIYSQYPEIEIREVDDYTKYVPQNVPNKEWNLFGADYHMMKDDHYPIKTYREFETEQEKDEVKIIDPIATLLESMAKVKPGEQFWIQISAEPMGEAVADDWVKEGEVLRDKLANREEKVPRGQKPIIQEIAEVFISGKPPGTIDEKEKEETREVIPAEMKLTPGEREVVQLIEKKISKPVFKCTARFIYLGKREIFFKPNFRLAFAYFQSFVTLNVNSLFVMGAKATLTKINESWFLPLNLIRPRRLYLRCRKIFRNYVRRFPPFWPLMKRAIEDRAVFVLSTEELASLFHFPSEKAAPAPGVARAGRKRMGPSELSYEEQ